MKKKIILSSIAVITLCLCLIAGSTYALFTETTTVNIAVTAGDLNITAEVVKDSEELRSLKDADGEFNRDKFANGGDATLENGLLKINRMTPGDAVRFQVIVKNTGNVAAKYHVKWDIQDVQGEPQWKDVLKISVYDASGNLLSTDDYSALGAPGKTSEFVVVVEFENGTPDRDNPYQGKAVDVQFTVEAVQENGVDDQGNLIPPTNP
jgi:predicted ribosomally synthesized peptide with SipW-like signal peptide